MIKKYLLTGIVILLPVALTLVVIIFLFDFFTAPFVTILNPLIHLVETQLPFPVPHWFVLFLARVFSLVFLCLFILFLGFVTQWLLIKNLFGLGNKIMSRIPIIKTIYKVAHEIFSALFDTEGKKAFQEAVMGPFPLKGSYCMGFRAGEVADECREKIPVPVASVFVPTAPHPISGFLVLVPEGDVKAVDLTNEEALKFLVSSGMIVPESPSRLPNES